MWHLGALVLLACRLRVRVNLQVWRPWITDGVCYRIVTTDPLSGTGAPQSRDDILNAAIRAWLISALRDSLSDREPHNGVVRWEGMHKSIICFWFTDLGSIFALFLCRLRYLSFIFLFLSKASWSFHKHCPHSGNFPTAAQGFHPFIMEGCYRALLTHPRFSTHHLLIVFGCMYTDCK
jgi:hypothetical protein